MHCYKNEYNLNRTYYEMFRSKKLDCVDRIVFTKFAIEQLHKRRRRVRVPAAAAAQQGGAITVLQWTLEEDPLGH
ncbi:Neutral Alpha-Glucosidase Ab [Manis pentadactyla]|nr:Neutral Alpha-Glucosidase Ab [Manis pentadactyla]